MITPCRMNWDMAAVADMQAIAEAVCAVLNEHLAQRVAAG